LPKNAIKPRAFEILMTLPKLTVRQRFDTPVRISTAAENRAGNNEPELKTAVVLSAIPYLRSSLN
jgi:hypothetical protein